MLRPGPNPRSPKSPNHPSAIPEILASSKNQNPEVLDPKTTKTKPGKTPSGRRGVDDLEALLLPGGLRVKGSGLRAEDLGLRVKGLRFWVWGQGFRVKSLGSRV